MIEEEKDIYNICLDKKSLYCIRRMGEETCNKCKTYQMYRLGLAEGRKEKCFEQNKDGTIRPCEVMKDNEELKEDVESLASINIKAQNIIAELKTQIENYQLAENESKEIIDDLKAQIIDIKEDVERERNKQRRLENDFTTDILNNLLNKWS